MNDIVGNCIIHGETTYLTQKSGKGIRHRCRKCDTDAVIKRRKKLKSIAVEYCGGKCIRCGYDDHEFLEVFEFHHKNPNKKDLV